MMNGLHNLNNMFVYLGKRDFYYITNTIDKILYKDKNTKYQNTIIAKLIYVKLTDEQHQTLNRFSAITLASLEEIIIM